ncbi:DUF6074 family protein [Jiella marina]|uniref:DUF6074 family protein n=1 Tax=Jiella sp. LLJ827 TaxID=2917712 RepID=UPI002101D21F|nr:DUF6074 family protein [Jiella sp. LLJ827]MCQ0990353.1 DUF6074 family protein [Jiella sp. LLJ827]
MTAQILVFPSHRRVGKIRQAVASLRRAQTQKDFTARWLQTTRILKSQLLALGLPREAVIREVGQFSLALECAIDVYRQKGELPSEIA